MEELAEVALRSALAGVSAAAGVTVSGIWKELVPQGQAFPALVFQMQSALDVDTHSGRSWVDARYLVKAVSEGYDDRNANALALAIDNALNHQRIEGSGVRLEDVHRINRISTTETRDGKVYRHRGGSYRMMIVIE